VTNAATWGRSFQPRTWVILLILLTGLLQLPAILHPHALDDEEVHTVVARELVQGGLPYLNAVENKPPLLFWTYALILKVAGPANWPALHLVALAWILLTMLGLYLTGRELFNRAAGIVAALLYALFHAWAHWKNLAFSGELMMNLPIVWAMFITLRPSRSKARLELLVAGALACAGFLLKQPGAVAAVPLGIYLLLPSYRTQRGFRIGHSLLHAVLFTLGFFGSLGLVVLVLRAQGILPAAYYWIIGNHRIADASWNRAWQHTLAFIALCGPLVLGAVIALRDRALWVERRAERTALILLVAAAAIGTGAGMHFYPHYYIQLVPPLALLAAPALALAWRKDKPAAARFLSPPVLTTWLAVTAIGFVTSYLLGLAGQRGISDAGQYVLSHSSVEDRLFVWGQATRIYLDAERRPACRYIATDPLTGYRFGAGHAASEPDDNSNRVPGAWANFQRDIAEHPPVYFVDTESGPGARYPVSKFPLIARLLADHYRQVYRAADGVVYRRLEGP